MSEQPPLNTDQHDPDAEPAANAVPRALGAPEASEIAPVPEAPVVAHKRPDSKAAGGMGAILSSMRHMAREMGVWRGASTLLKANQEAGFDCPGCAWPDPPKRSSFEFCENGAKAIAAEATRGRLDAAFFKEWSVEALIAQPDMWLERQGRLTQPMILREGATHYSPIGWDEAFELIAAQLKGLESPDEALFYTSGRTSNEAAFLYQLFVRRFGTNNLPDCSNMCHESSGAGLGATIGVGKGTVGLADFEEAEAIFVIGQNPGTNHPRMLTHLQEAARRGCKIVSVNPLREKALESFIHPQEAVRTALGLGTPISSHFLQVRVGGDVALLKGMMKALFEMEAQRPGEVFDQAFIETHTLGFEAFKAALEEVAWDTIVTESGISREQIEVAAKVYAASKATIVCWAMGLTQHKHAVANIQEVVNLLLLKGNLGRPGAGACPVRGHSNVQGDRTMGIAHKPKAAFLDKLKEVFDFEPPREHGLDVVDGIEAMLDGRVKVFFAMGGNFHSATPDTAATSRALRRCALTVQVSTKLNRSHLVTGRQALILPCLGRTERDTQRGGEQFVSVENSMSIVHPSQGRLDPAGEQLLSEPAIVARMAAATLGAETPIAWAHVVEDYDRIRDLIASVVPGCEDYNRRVRERGGFLLPNGARDRRWNTQGGKAHFTVHPVPTIPLEADQYLMMTMRSHDQYNTTIYGLEDRYRGIKRGRRVVLMHPDDIAEAGLSADQVVNLTSHFQGETREAPRFVVVPYDLPRRCVATYFPEANPLVPLRSVADKSNTPTSKSVVVSMRPA